MPHQPRAASNPDKSVTSRPGAQDAQRLSNGSGAAARLFLPADACRRVRENVVMGSDRAHDRVEAGWQAIRNDGRVNPELIDAAYAEPRLRMLFPWTGMGELHFSRCTGTRWNWDVPHISPAVGGGYWVLGPSRSECAGQVDTAEQAIALVVEWLPAGCGPAFVGTPEELAAYEASHQGIED